MRRGIRSALQAAGLVVASGCERMRDGWPVVTGWGWLWGGWLLSWVMLGARLGAGTGCAGRASRPKRFRQYQQIHSYYFCYFDILFFG